MNSLKITRTKPTFYGYGMHEVEYVKIRLSGVHEEIAFRLTHSGWGQSARNHVEVFTNAPYCDRTKKYVKQVQSFCDWLQAGIQ